MQVDAMAARRWTYSMLICGRMLVPVHSVLKSLVILLTVFIAAPFALAQKAQGPSGYPSRLVKIIVPTAPGGNADLLARVLGERMSSDWGQPVVIENRPGAANRIGIAAGAKSPPDGYTLIVVPVSNLVMDPHIYSTLPYDVFRDLEPISLVTQVQNVLVINSAHGIKTIKALVELAKAKPDELTFAAVGVGSPAHIASEMMNLRAVDSKWRAASSRCCEPRQIALSARCPDDLRRSGHAAFRGRLLVRVHGARRHSRRHPLLPGAGSGECSQGREGVGSASRAGSRAYRLHAERIGRQDAQRIRSLR